MKNLYRSLIIASVVATTLLWLLPYFDYSWLSEEELDVLSWSGYGAPVKFSNIYYWGVYVAWIAISFGLYCFISFVRKIFIIFIALSLCMGFLYGLTVQTPLALFLDSILTLIDGIIIALSYFSSVRLHFEVDQK